MEITAIKCNKNQEIFLTVDISTEKQGSSQSNGVMEAFEENLPGQINAGHEIKFVSEHCHEPEPGKVEGKLFCVELKTRAVLTEEKPKSCILEAHRFVTIESGPTLPSNFCNQRLINRVWQEIQPRIEVDTTLKITLPEDLNITHTGEAFLQHDTGGDDPERILILATLDNVDTI